MMRLLRETLAVALAIAVVGGAVTVAADSPPDCAATLDALERGLSARPNDLFGGADYRQAAIRCQAFDRSIGFFERLAKAHRGSPEVRLNLALALVDKIPTSGDLRQALLGRDAVKEFGASITIEPTWLAHYTRGFIYLNYPRAFGAGRKAIADFEQAIALQSGQPLRPHHARAWVALGDAHYWRLSDLARARQIWAEGLARFPDDEALRIRVHSEGMPLRDAIRRTMNPDVRVDTSLRELR